MRGLEHPFLGQSPLDLLLRPCEHARLGENRIGPPAQNRKKNAEEWILASPSKIGEKWAQNLEPHSGSAIFLVSGPVFPCLRGEAKIHVSAIFSCFGHVRSSILFFWSLENHLLRTPSENCETHSKPPSKNSLRTLPQNPSQKLLRTLILEACAVP